MKFHNYLCTATAVAFLYTADSIQAQTYFPPDAQSTNCSVSGSEFAQWFANGQISLNGIVNSANGAVFPALQNTKCDFYKWGARMFLWITSPSTQFPGGGPYIFDSPVFYDVSVESGGQRKLLSNAEGNSFGIRHLKDDEALPEEIGETGQAGGGGVLMSQKGSLVYYGIHVNDVYAYFLKGQKEGKIKQMAFPHSPANIYEVINYAQGEGKTLIDARAMTMELKTAWVEVSTLDNPGAYLTITAEVPNYNHSSNQKWVQQGTRFTRLALVGVHIVGTVNGHPEMVWATIEHVSNAPDETYLYNDNGSPSQIKQVNFRSGQSWTFMPSSGTPEGANQERMKIAGGSSTGDIVVTNKSASIGPSNTTRVNPWGNPGVSRLPDPSLPYPPLTNAQIAENNAELISLNNDILGFLMPGDVRKNYFLSGAVWTKTGKIPSSSGGDATQVGSLSLANTTMETYHQYPQKGFPAGCFSCHQIFNGGGKTPALSISHIYGAIVPEIPE